MGVSNSFTFCRYSIVDVNSGGQSRYWAREMSDCINEGNLGCNDC